MSKKYLILTATYWSWHNAAASALKKYLESKWDEVLIVDMVDLKWYIWEISQKMYKFSSEIIPILWWIMFKILNTKFVDILFRLSLVRFYWKRFNKIASEFNPDFIIWVYPLWQIFVWDYKKKFNKDLKYWVLVTDCEVSLQWYSNDKIIDKFFLIDDNSKKDLEGFVPDRKKDIFTSFFPIEEKYFLDKNSIWNKNICIILTWLSKSFCAWFLKEIKNKNFFERVIILKWRNDKLYNYLKNNYKDDRFEFLDFIKLKEELKNIDIMISKPGWATISECIAQDVFIISPSYIWWQEEWNIKLLQNYWVWIYEKDWKEVVNFLENWYKDIDVNNFKKLKNKRVLEDIVEKLK